VKERRWGRINWRWKPEAESGGGNYIIYLGGRKLGQNIEILGWSEP
jgi:hypothetical protein